MPPYFGEDAHGIVKICHDELDKIHDRRICLEQRCGRLEALVRESIEIADDCRCEICNAFMERARAELSITPKATKEH